jgi:trehalose 2-sulfotransferase
VVPYGCYIICGTPRSGSTLLCNLLRDAGCGRPRSYFRRQSIARIAAELGVPAEHDLRSEAFAADYVEAVRRAARGRSDVSGIRVMYENLHEMSELLVRSLPAGSGLSDPIAQVFGRPLYIHLSREDKVAQAISLFKAEYSGLWHISPDGEEIERTAPHKEPFYDGPRIAALVDSLTGDDAGWDAWFAQHELRPLRVSYEEMACKPHAALSDILSRIGMDPSTAASLPISTGKLSDRQSADWSRRFRSEYPSY